MTPGQRVRVLWMIRGQQESSRQLYKTLANASQSDSAIAALLPCAIEQLDTDKKILENLLTAMGAE
jgi:hypothetical protein